MLRTILAIIAGLGGWILVVTLLNWGIRASFPGYTDAEPAMAFTLGMQLSRLSIAALTSVAAGFVVRAVASASRWAPWTVGSLLVLLFVPEHIQLWQKFPLWYHLTFLITLIPLVVLGSRLKLSAAKSRNEAPARADGPT